MGYAEELPHQIKSFTQAKKLASQVYRGHHETFYCGCSYDSKKRVDVSTCGYTPRKNAKRGSRIEWEHVVPAHAFGHTRQCWREPICTNKKGKAYKGRKCCEKVDPVFRAMVSDLNNLVPAVGELNGDRSNFTFTMLEGEPRKYGACDFEVDFKARKAEPSPEVRGDIARTYFYMHDTYGLPIGKKQRRLFEAWDKQDPVGEWEKERMRRIKLLYGSYE
jgi:deoxyribonuclease-1